MIPGQMFLMDRFFDGTFLTFGIEVISFAERDQEDRIDPMVRHYCQAQDRAKYCMLGGEGWGGMSIC